MARKALVTGVAGFVGSNLGECLVSEGWHVVGIDSFTDYYAPSLKEENVSALLAGEGFELHRDDLLSADLVNLLDGVDTVFHQAAQAGVRTSWGDEFDRYTSWNVLATQRVLEAAKLCDVRRIVLASSSSVYGDTTDLPARETSPTRPYSPYGVTKLAAEHLGRLYRRNFGMSVVALRYFTVYGPRQRPDMAFRRLFDASSKGEPFPLYGGGQTRDFTFVADTVRANLLAAECEEPSEVYNVGGGARIDLEEAIELIAEIAGSPIECNRSGAQKGDVPDTWADGTLAKDELGYAPEVPLREGLERMAAWHREKVSGVGG